MADGNGHSLKISPKMMQIFGWLALALYILIAQVVAPLIGRVEKAGNTIDLASIAQSNVQRITKLEAVVYQLGNVPGLLGTLTEAVNTLKTSVDKQGEKLDRHISRDIK